MTKDYRMKLELATKWKVKVDGKERSIQLFDKDGNELDGYMAYWPGNFRCNNNQLTSLVGSPKEVGGSFWCNNNQLTSLVGSPEVVGGSFLCDNNQLTSLAGSPKEVGGSFWCNNNQLTSLVGSPKEIARQTIISKIQKRLLNKNIIFADGVKEFCKGIDMGKKYSVREAIEMTNNKYGADKFKEFFK